MNPGLLAVGGATAALVARPVRRVARKAIDQTVQLGGERVEFGDRGLRLDDLALRQTAKPVLHRGTRTRIQAFEGVVIARRNRGMNSAFTVRKISHGEGVERTFQAYSPQIESISVVRRGDVRRAKIYYLRDLSGKKARIKEKLTARPKEDSKAKE